MKESTFDQYTFNNFISLSYTQCNECLTKECKLITLIVLTKARS
uniref:Uncharacterized protein n=1 Tax=Rhizophora mucronata TaxID=61149 RepID=A0A2P2NZ57_RHIMU